MGSYLALIYGVIVIAALVIIGLIKFIFAQDKGNEKMQQISDAIKEGAMAFLNRQYKTIAALALIVAVIIIIANYYGHLSEGTTAALGFAWRVSSQALYAQHCQVTLECIWQ